MHLVFRIEVPEGTDPKEIIAQLKERYAVLDCAVHRDDATEEARKIVNLWNTLRPGEAHIRLTPARIAKVRARLADGFTPDQLSQVVTRLVSSPFHMGVNDRKWFAPGPEWVLHTTERVEQWLRQNDSKPQTYAEQVKAFFGNGHRRMEFGGANGNPV